jgi:hypothetical protein
MATTAAAAIAPMQDDRRDKLALKLALKLAHKRKIKAAVAKKRMQMTDSILPQMLSTPAEAIYPDVLAWTLDEKKTHVVQLYIEEADPNEARKAMMLGLKGNVIKCIHSEHGNYVIQKIITQFPLASLDWLLAEISNKKDVIALIKHKFGCRIFCRLLEKFNEDDLAVIWDTILENVESLIADEYGCYPLTTYVKTQNSDKSRQSKDNIIIAHLLGVPPLIIWKQPTISCLAHALLQSDGELQEKLALALNTCILLEESEYLTKRRQRLVAAVDQYLLQKTNTQVNGQSGVTQQPENMQKTLENGSPTGFSATDKIPQIWTCQQVETSFGSDDNRAASMQLIDPSMNMMMPRVQSGTGRPVYWVPWSTYMNDVQQPVCWGWMVNNGQDIVVGVPIPICAQ